MHVLGLGSDILETARMGRLIQQHGELFLRRTFTEAEIVTCSRRVHAMQHYAVRWAVKQALVRALGARFTSDMRWSDLEVRGGLRAGWRVAVRGPLKEACAQGRVVKIMISAAFCRSAATATVLLLG
ncbi:MAG TPA: 4'-phosphopantetheinyl transferase superfamily protein, partial [Pirellulaceae bacterium]